jgi:hypothetical protein
MITPALEKLILTGKASYNTFVIGGSEKSILNVSNNRFIIITDITYFHQVNLPDNVNTISETELRLLLSTRLNTQLRIFSKKSNNLFLFRNFLNINASQLEVGDFIVTANGQTHLSTYLVHDQDVSFSFCTAGDQSVLVSATSPSKSIGFPPPFDYGLDGQTGAISVAKETRFAAGQATRSVPAGNQYENLPLKHSFEFTRDFNISSRLRNLESASAYPIVLVGYVEINGTPTNVGATL